jgi:hypothetical protein
MKKPPDSLFQKGNTFGRGRPQGSRNKTTIALQKILDGHGESITKKCALLALQGNPMALRLCMERLIPPRKEHPVKLKLARVTTAAETSEAVSDVLQAVVEGQLLPSEAETITTILDVKRRAIETHEHDKRIDVIESQRGDRRQEDDLIYRPPKAA